MPTPEELLLARLDRQATAIRDLRARVTALEASAASPPSPVAAPGVFVPRPSCAMCGETKEAGRSRTLTCRTCAARWHAGIKKTSERITFAACLNCETPKADTTQMLCSPCGKSFRVWKAAQ
jgi:hypothetical protein